MARREAPQLTVDDPIRRILCLVFVAATALSSAFIARGATVELPHALIPGRSLLPAQAEQEPAVLEPGKPIVRELAAGEKHSYQITLIEGQYLKVEIKQLGAEVRVSLQQPDSKSIPVRDMFLRMQKIAFERVLETSGTYRLEVYARTKAPTGRYEILISELRAATESERALQQARTSSEEFIQLQRGGKYVEARPLIVRALEIRERVLGPEHFEVAETLAHLANNYEITGDYASAEPLHQRALEIKEKILGPDHPAVAAALSRLGVFAFGKGDYFKAEELLQKALGVFEKTHQADSITISSALAYLGDIYHSRSDYERAENHYRRSLAIREKLLGPDHIHLAPSYSQLGRVAYDAGEYARAEAMFQRALALTEKTLGPDHIRLIPCLNDLAMFYSTAGDYEKAEALYRRTMSIHERVGMNDRNAPETLAGLARLYAAKGMSSDAVKFQSRASELEERFVRLNLTAGSEREKLAFLGNLSLRSSRQITLHANFAPDDPAARDLAVTTVLRSKGRVQDAMSESLAALRIRFGAEDRALLDRLNDVTSKLANLVLNGQQQMTSAQHQQQVKTFEDQREGLEGEVGRRSAGSYNRSQPAALTAIRAAIPVNAALLEFAVYRLFDPKAPDNRRAYGEQRYVVYVIRNQDETRWAELGAATEIDRAIDALRQALRDPQRKDAHQLARDVDERVMRAVRPLLGDATQLLISPGGALNLIPFEALVDEQNRYLVERFSCTYLTSGRDLLRLQVARASKSPPLVLANPLFGEPELMAMAKPNPPASPRAALDRKQHGGAKRQSVTTGSDLSSVYFAPLSGTAQEAQSIKSLFAEARVLAGTQATESSLKQVSAPSIIHIATHGFFLTDTPPPPSSASGEKTRAISGNLKVENPLLRSGLALAGANMHKSGDDDGILTALEASGLNLWGTKLVTLSACDTGVGEVKNGEGVYGLRRAFVLAGTETLVMSLWPVSDYVTRELMTAYYKGLKQGQGRGEALRQVQLSMLKRKGRDHPFYWASFIQSGEWANLDGKR